MNSLSHCHWKLCGRTEELDDFQHSNGEWQQDRILDCRKETAARTRKHTIHSCGFQNTAARLVFNLRKYDRITLALVTLHWLPFKSRFEFKTLLIVFKGLHGKAPTYIRGMITPSKSKRYSIRSNEERVLKVPKFKHDTFGKRAFAVFGPLAWNCLPKEIRLCDEIEAFKRILKTHLFVKFVNESTLAIWFWRIIVKRPRMLYAQFVALYKPCKPKPKPNFQVKKFIFTMTNGILSWYRKTTESEVQKYEDVFLYKCRVSGFQAQWLCF